MEVTMILCDNQIASNSLKIQCFMIGRSTLISGVTFSETVSNEGQYN